jgi:hypothetical protein
LTFTVTRNDNKIAYEGKLADGKINIKVHLPNGDREYQLIRVVDISGPWQTKLKIPDGAELELKYQFKVDGEKLTGSVESPAGQIDLREGKIAGDEISYKLTIGDRDVSYTGKIADGKINLKSRGGPLGDLEYLLTRVVNLATMAAIFIPPLNPLAAVLIGATAVSKVATLLYDNIHLRIVRTTSPP